MPTYAALVNSLTLERFPRRLNRQGFHRREALQDEQAELLLAGIGQVLGVLIQTLYW